MPGTLTTAPLTEPDPELDALLFTVTMTPEGRADPYPHYRRLAQRAPVYRTSAGPIVLTRFEDCNQILRDNRFGKPTEEGAAERRRELAEGAGLSAVEADEVMGFFGRRSNMLFLNPPDHTRLRGLVSRAFTPRTVEKLRPKVDELTRELLDPLGTEADVMDAVAWRLPATVISELLGVPVADRETLRPLVHTAARLLEPMVDREAILSGIEASRGLEAYLAALIAERRRRPEEDLLSLLIAARDGSDALSEDELLSTASLLFGAGFETTTNLIGNGLLALVRNPDQLALLRTRPGIIALAVEELLRYDSPVQFDGRAALEPAEVAGHPVEEGQQVMTLLAAANRDPSRYSVPDALRADRDEGLSISFAAGIHHCLGAALARMEGQVFFTRFLDTFRSFELTVDEPRRRDAITLRGLEELPLRLQRA